MESARIIYVGAVRGSDRKLRHVLAAGGNVVGIIGLDPAKAAKHSDYYDLVGTARIYGIKALHSSDLNESATLKWISEQTPDFIFLWGWSQLVGQSFLTSARVGVIGFHPSLLPLNRGRHPVIWALVKGLRETGVTFFFLEKRVDCGDILAQQSIKIDQSDDATALMAKIDKTARKLIFQFVPQLVNGSYQRLSQDHRKATYLPKRTYEDGRIDWHGSVWTAHNLVRALAKPYPGANAMFNGLELTVYSATPISIVHKTAKAGEIVAIDEEGVSVALADGMLKLKDGKFDGMTLKKAIKSGLFPSGQVMS